MTMELGHSLNEITITISAKEIEPDNVIASFDFGGKLNEETGLDFILGIFFSDKFKEDFNTEILKYARAFAKNLANSERKDELLN